jgi:Uma2 family endonuclease
MSTPQTIPPQTKLVPASELAAQLAAKRIRIGDEPPIEIIHYPDSDGKPMADNTKQFDKIVEIKLGLESIFADRDDVFIAGDLLWYPEQGNNRFCLAPDVMVAFGRPKGARGSYKQWLESGIAPQVVFEVLSPSNTMTEMLAKHDLYERLGAEEFYICDPDTSHWMGWMRGEVDSKQDDPKRDAETLPDRDALEPITTMTKHISPRLGIGFGEGKGETWCLKPDGNRFESYLELETRANSENARAETEKNRADSENARAEKLAEKLRTLGINPDEL